MGTNDFGYYTASPGSSSKRLALHPFDEYAAHELSSFHERLRANAIFRWVQNLRAAVAHRRNILRFLNENPGSCGSGLLLGISRSQQSLRFIQDQLVLQRQNLTQRFRRIGFEFVSVDAAYQYLGLEQMLKTVRIIEGMYNVWRIWQCWRPLTIRVVGIGEMKPGQGLGIVIQCR